NEGRERTRCTLQLYRKASKIEDPKFREAHEKVWHLKNHDQKPKKGQPPPPLGPHDP
ncbi:unnamed protein product, partial [Pylaiella littoralis]